MNKPFFYTAAALILLTAASRNAFCQAVMTMKTETNFREFEDKTIFEGDTLNGKIKTITQNTYGEYSKGKDIIYTFDEYGLHVRRQGLGQDIFTYYNFNKFVKSEIYYVGTGELGRTNERIYDDNGNLIKHISKIIPMKNSFSDFDYFVTYYKYNEKNQLIEKEESEKRKKSNEEMRFTIKYQYDENGDCVIEKGYDGKVLKEHKYINHKLVETFSWQLSDGMKYYKKDLYQYNEDGTLNSIIHYSSYTEEFSEKDKGITFYYYTYDNNNRLIEYKSIDEEGYYTIITYENFDEKGNWQLKITNKDGKISEIKRRFEYF